MLSQAAGDRQILARQLGISPTQLSYVTHSNAGEGLLFYGNTIIPFVDHFPKDTELYRIMTTKKFLAAHETEILLHKAAKAAFDKLCLQKLPTYKTLQAEYAGLLAEKKKAYAEYAAAKKEMQAVLTAKANVDRLLGAPPERPEQEKEQAQR